MSQVSNSKGKDVGRKYTSFNLSSTFKGSKGETKSTTGQSTRHGLQSLGKIGQCRRVPQPANLPSLKKENLGNDPRINLVPSGSQGWGKKETQKQGDARPTGPSVGPNKPTVSKVGETEVSLRPNAGVATSVKPPSSGLDSQGQTKATWVNKTQPQQQPPAGSSSYFQREFPKLGGVDGKGEDGKEKDHTEGGDQDVNHQAMGHPSFMNGQKWMDATSGPMFVPPNFPAQFTGERPVFNGNQQHYPYPPYPIYPGPSGRGIPMPPYPYPYPYPGPAGKMPFDPAFLQRMAKPSFMGPPSSQAESRPSVIKDSDFKSLEVDKDDNGWAGAQEEVDYNAKLKFDESDDSDEDIPRKNSEGKKLCQDNKDEKDGSQKKQKPPEGWSGYPHGYPPHMQMPYGQQNWNRVQFPGYDPQRGPPPPGPHGYPFHPMYFMPPYGFPQNLPPQQKDKTENDQKQAEKSETPRIRSDDRKDLDRKAAAQAKLRSLEEKIRKREEGKLKSEEFSKKHDSDDGHSRSRVRNDSEASDSSRRTVKKEIPPRFQRQISVQQDVSEVNDQSESQHLRIMQRKDSLKSEDETCKENKKIDVFTEMSNKCERSGDRNTEHRSRQSSSSSLYQETVKSERQKRYSSSSDTHDKEKLSRQGSNTSDHSKEGERAELYKKDALNGDSKKVDRDSDRSRSREKAELHEKKGKSDHRVKSTEMSRIDSQRFADLKLTKGQTKQSRLAKEEIEQAAIQEKQKEVPKKASAWSNIVSGEDADTSNKPSEVGKSLLEIQQEEEEEENRKTQSVTEEKTFQHGQDRKVESYDKYRNNSSPHENKFRSDDYIRNEKTRYLADEKYEKKSEQRRGRFGERTDRKPPRDDNYKGSRFDNTRADSYSKDNRRRDKRDDYYQKSERRDDCRKEHKRAGYRKDERNFKKDEARDEFKTDEGRVDTGKNDRSDYAKKHERRDEQGVKKEDQKDTVKDDERDDKRASYKKENQKRYERRDRRDDRRYEKRSEDKRRDNDRKDDKREREVNKKYDRKDTCEDKRYDKKRNDWSNRDYRQCDEYQKDLKARQAQKEKRELKKSEDEQQHVEKPNMSKGDTVIDSTSDKVNKVEDVDTASVSVYKEGIVTILSDGTECKENNISNEVGERTENVSKLKSFGVPPDKNEYAGLKSDKSDRHDDNYSCRGRESIKGRGRGRGHSSRSSHNQTSSRSQRPNSSSGYSRSYNSRSGEGKRRYDLEYETISSGDFSDSSDNNEKTKPSRKEHKKSDHVKSWEADKPPRFQHKEERGGHRGRGRGTRGSDRGRGADRGRSRGRGRGFHSSQSSSRVGSSTAGKEFDGKTEDDSELFCSAEESASPTGHEGENERYRNSYSQDRGKTRPRGAYKPGRGDRESRGSSRGSRGGKTSSFLLNRQQVGDKRTSKEEGSLSAADKTMYSSEVQIKSNLEGFNEHSPPKKSKPLAEKKRDISREFDLNNIASVVCIDDINTDFDQSNKSKEEDGFVIVTSKKHQKEIRDRQREEEKQKVLLEQKREAIAVSKLLKTARKENQKNAAYHKNKTSSFTDALISSATVEQVPVPADTAALPPSHPLASNAAMAAIGAWEPAQSLMRTSQQNNSTSTTEQAKTSLVSSANAWQRPLSLSAAPITSMPDPRAVGTGKPSSSHVILANKSSLVPTQPTPEAASPLVTPPALAPIGSSAMNKLPQGLPTELESSSVQGEEEKDDSTKENIQTKDVRSDKNKGKEKSDVKREKPVNKRVIRDRPPRFQTNTRKDTDDRNHYEEPRKTSRQSSTDSKSRKRSADRQRKLDNVKSVNNVTKHEKKKSVEKRHSQDLDVIFINGMSTAPQPAGHKSILSDADKVVGSNKPSLKPRSSGSYTADNEDNMVEVQMKETYQAPDKQISSEEEEQNAKDTARSVIKSLNDDEERSLETRSLPGTPPLAVKIPEPTLSGPSSDPGRAPSPNVNKNLAPTLVHEMNEMNRRLFYARKAWDDTPTASSTPSTVVVASMTSVATVVADVSSAPVSPTKSESVTTVSESLLKPTEEKVSVSGGTFANKRSEQQNVCKVKPQQQLPSEEVKPYHVSSHQGHLLSSQREQAHILPTQREQVNVNLSQSSKFAPYVMPVDRQIQQNTLYMSDSVYGEHVRSQSNPALNFQSLNQVRSIDPSVSLHQDLLLNMYGNTPIQASQLAWQVVSTSNVRPSKSGAYQTHSQGSLFTSPVSVSNTPVIMQYGTNFLPQRTGGNLQRQTVGLMPVPQQQQQTPAGRVVIPTQQTVPQMRRDQQHYQNLHATTQTHLSTGQMSQAHLSGGQISQTHLTAGRMTLLLDPNTGMPQSQQITAQQRSDLMKHVHAKPFEPTPQTPPLMQSPPVVNHQSIPSLPQQHIMPTVFSQPSPGATHLHSQNGNRYSQPLLQHGQRQHNVQHLTQQTPLVASVRPRSVQAQVATSSPLPNTNQDRLRNMSAFDPNLAMLVNALTLKTRPVAHGGSAIHVPPQSMNNQFAHHNIHHRSQQRNVLNTRSPNGQQSRTNGGPGPIQRPSQGQHANAHLPSAHLTKPPSFNSNAGANEVDFKKNQRQKMLEDTKRYFQENLTPASKVERPKQEEKPVSTPTTNPNLSKHDKYILPDVPKDNPRKYDYKKGQRNAGGGNDRSCNQRRAASTGSDGAKEQKRNTSKS